MPTVRYEIHLRGVLSESTIRSFDGMRATVEPVETVLHGAIADQAQLHAVLGRVEDLGLELVEVRRVADPAQ